MFVCFARTFPYRSLSFPLCVCVCVCQQVSLDITAANASGANEKGPDFAGPEREKVAAGAASFNGSVVKWERPLKADGELAVVEASLFIGTSTSEWFRAQRLFSQDHTTRSILVLFKASFFLCCPQVHSRVP